MHLRDIDMKAAFGKPAVSFVGLQHYYDRYEDKDHPIFKRDRAWFASHPKHQRFIRPAMGDEFDHKHAYIDHNGVRISAPKLWVSVERRLCGQKHSVQTVYRGACFWDVDAAGYMLPNDEADDASNVTVDGLLFQMHLASGAHPVEISQHAEKLAEVILSFAPSSDDKKVQ